MPALRLAPWWFALLAAACSGPQVRSVGTGGMAPAYEVRADTPADVHAQAARLCSGGYVVLREGQSSTQPMIEDSAFTRWLIAGGQWVSGLPGNVAQATIVCRV